MAMLRSVVTAKRITENERVYKHISRNSFHTTIEHALDAEFARALLELYAALGGARSTIRSLHHDTFRGMLYSHECPRWGQREKFLWGKVCAAAGYSSDRTRLLRAVTHAKTLLEGLGEEDPLLAARTRRYVYEQRPKNWDSMSPKERQEFEVFCWLGREGLPKDQETLTQACTLWNAGMKAFDYFVRGLERKCMCPSPDDPIPPDMEAFQAGVSYAEKEDDFSSFGPEAAFYYFSGVLKHVCVLYPSNEELQNSFYEGAMSAFNRLKHWDASLAHAVKRYGQSEAFLAGVTYAAQTPLKPGYFLVTESKAAAYGQAANAFVWGTRSVYKH